MTFQTMQEGQRMQKTHKKIFRDPSKSLKNISWPINICLKHFMTPPQKASRRRRLLTKHTWRHGCYQKLLFLLMLFKNFCINKHKL